MLVLTGFISDSSKYIYVCVYIYTMTLSWPAVYWLCFVPTQELGKLLMSGEKYNKSMC